MEQTTRASSSGRKKAQQWNEERNKSVHFASPLATTLKKKMTPAEKQEAKNKARRWAENRHRSQSSTKISKKRQNTKLKRNQNSCIIFANVMSNEVRGVSNPSADISSDSIASRVKRYRRAKI
jgi:2-succinyl-5-enolpyruvyl-6-hydroxy-3-cyclohexene-1-carboxylate synthase